MRTVSMGDMVSPPLWLPEGSESRLRLMRRRPAGPLPRAAARRGRSPASARRRSARRSRSRSARSRSRRASPGSPGPAATPRCAPGSPRARRRSGRGSRRAVDRAHHGQAGGDLVRDVQERAVCRLDDEMAADRPQPQALDLPAHAPGELRGEPLGLEGGRRNIRRAAVERRQIDRMHEVDGGPDGAGELDARGDDGIARLGEGGPDDYAFDPGHGFSLGRPLREDD